MNEKKPAKNITIISTITAQKTTTSFLWWVKYLLQYGATTGTQNDATIQGNFKVKQIN